MADLGLRRIIGPPKPMAVVPPPAPVPPPRPTLAGVLGAPILKPAADAVMQESTRPNTSVLQRAVNIMSRPFQSAPQQPDALSKINGKIVNQNGLRRTLKPPTVVIGVRG